MGKHIVNKCIFTDLPVTPISGLQDVIEYTLQINGNRFDIHLPPSAKKWPLANDFFKTNKSLFHSLLYNNKWPGNYNSLIELDDLRDILEKSDYPQTPEDKLNNLLLKLFDLQNEDGEEISLPTDYTRNKLWKELYFKSQKEFIYYLKYLGESRLVRIELTRVNDNFVLKRFSISFEGLQKIIALQGAGKNSNLCFIAMSFKEETKPTREAIKTAILKTGYRPLIIDEENVDSDKTINDAIIAGLKKCSFCIADFSFHSNGVYFESGFALGQGKKVVYTCSKAEFRNAHFDIRPLQHIIYDDVKKLETDLIDKIEAWIK